MQHLPKYHTPITDKEKWRTILEEVEQHKISVVTIPIEVVDLVIVHLIDGTKVDIGIQDLIQEGGKLEDIEVHLSKSLSKLEKYINDIDFNINTDLIMEAVQPITDRLLRHL